MSAILGAVEFDGRPVAEESFERMLASLAWRGPDGSAAWRDAGIALGHRRLTVLEGAPRQPLERALGDAALVLVADLRLDNRSELLDAFGLSSRSAASDEELLLWAYERWGERCPERLLGDFAFALWDGRERRLLCARDALGTRSLYYHRGPQRFVFATEIKALRAHGEVPDELDDESVADYLGQVFLDSERTFYRAIRRLPPAHALHVSATGTRQWRYWSLDPELRVELADDREYADAFRSLLTEAIGCRMRTERRLGMLLSGGLDSSAMVCMARQRRAEWGHSPLPVLSARFPGFPHIDEGTFIDEVVAPGGVEPHSVSVGATSPLRDAEEMLAHNDEPFYWPNLFVYWALARRARELGLSVLLDGVDGDTTVGHGLEWVAELLRGGRVRRAVAESRALARHFQRPTREFLWHSGVRPGFVLPWRHRIRALLGTEVPPPPATMAPDLAARVAWGERLRARAGALLAPATSLRESHWRALTSGLVPHFLEVDDRASAAFGVESRHPYFDRRLVEFCYGTPPDQKLSGGWDRVVQRRALEGVLPERIRWRTDKSYWGDAFQAGFLQEDRGRIESVLASPGSLGNYVDLAALGARWARCRSGQRASDDVMNLWLAVTLGLWLGTVRTAG